MAKKQKGRLTAAALEYRPPRDAAPRLTAKGKGLVAEKIIELAQKHRIPIRKDPGLVEILTRLDIDEQIPPELYKAVAEILVYVYSLNEQWRSRKNFP
ncbi:MAG: EscU/YscU/HrcU family type III secretion system export apparatus switch protein [Syntrophales bacterium]